jgi:hypothetical protein
MVYDPLSFFFQHLYRHGARISFKGVRKMVRDKT